MKIKSFILLLRAALVVLLSFILFSSTESVNEDEFLSFIVDPQKQNLQFYWKNDKGEPYRSIANLKQELESKNTTLIFATNGGMYTKENAPKGLFVQNGKTLFPLDTCTTAIGNFYLQPNGVFYITTSNRAVVCKTTNFVNNGKVNFATQSGPMLLIDGKIHPAFKPNSTNLNIRNGVGVLPNNNVVFVMSKTEVSFYEFAQYFKTLGCSNALYLDGFVSRTYLPSKQSFQTDGNFGVIIGLTAKK